MNQKIFKVQRPLNHDKTALIYDRTKSFMGEVPLSDSIKKMMGNEYKMYVKGYIDSKGQLHITNKTTPQIW